MAGKVIVGLASHWPCVTDISGSPSMGTKGDEQPPMLYYVAWSTSPLSVFNYFIEEDIVRILPSCLQLRKLPQWAYEVV